MSHFTLYNIWIHIGGSTYIGEIASPMKKKGNFIKTYSFWLKFYHSNQNGVLFRRDRSSWTYHKFKFLTVSRLLARARIRICFSLSDDMAKISSKTLNIRCKSCSLLLYFLSAIFLNEVNRWSQILLSRLADDSKSKINELVDWFILSRRLHGDLPKTRI